VTNKSRDLVHKSTKVVCYYCKKPGHTLAVYRKRLAKLMNSPSSNEPVQLISTLDSVAADGLPSTPAVQHDRHKPDTRFESHCVDAVVVRPDQSVHTVCVLRDTGALQSLVSSQILTESDYRSIDEVRLIRRVTEDIISVPLVEISLNCALCIGTYLCGLVSTLPSGIAVLVGNDLCPDMSVAQAALLKAEEAPPDEVQNLPEAVSETHSGVMPDVTCDPNIDVLSLFADSSVDKVDRAELIRLQQHYPDLS